ncbi:MAG: helix-turn-helix transcriptional regulator, partial [Oscillospiraceae bacterium]|nr:helix-turn-helix transcriptional regulator [Oscillospiraceae bacterium]
LLRKECGLSQKQAAKKLDISQALLSHYEKGIRECGLDFLIKAADFYNVSCDYLLGRSPERSGNLITVDEIPEPEAIGKESHMKGSVLPILNKKLISNSLNILFDLLSKCGSKELVSDISQYLMIAVYKMFRITYKTNIKNQSAMFNVPEQVYRGYSNASMNICEERACALTSGHLLPDQQEIPNPELLAITTESLAEKYPLFATSLLNLIQNTESKVYKIK